MGVLTRYAVIQPYKNPFSRKCSEWAS